jgi:ABC-type cobalt transport system substrate-binding protein
MIPMTLILAYYAFWVVGVVIFMRRFPALGAYLPLGGIDDLASSNIDTFEPVYTMVERTLFSPTGPFRLLLASTGACILTIPISWVYFITSRARRIDQSFLQTLIILPVVVTGIAMIVVNSLALAFSLAGVVAAVRFRFTLDQPSDAMYIFVAIGIGLGSGIGALGVSTVISLTFVIATLIIWKLEYGKTLAGPFLTMLTRRDGGEDDY